MAFEATIVHELEQPINFTCADGTAITKGAVLKMTDPMTAAASDGASDTFAGLCFGDKIASNGQTRVAVIRHCIAKVKCSGAITVGDPIATSATANHFNTARTLTQNQLSGTRIAGYMLETVADGDTGLALIQPMSMPSL